MGKTNESKVDLGMIVREIDELWSSTMRRITSMIPVWLGSSRFEDIHNRLKQKDHFLSLQMD